MKFDTKERKALEIVTCAIIAITQEMNIESDREIEDIEILGAVLDTRKTICCQGDTPTTRRMNHRLSLLNAYIDERRRQNDRFIFPYLHSVSDKNEFFDACLQIPALRHTALHTQTDQVLSLYRYTHDFMRWLKTKVQIAITKNADGLLNGFVLDNNERLYYDVEYDDEVSGWLVRAPRLTHELQKRTVMLRKEAKLSSNPDHYMRRPKFDANQSIEAVSHNDD